MSISKCLSLIDPCGDPPFLPSHTNVDAAKSFFLNCSPPNTPPISYSRECIFPTDSNMKCENLRFFLICFFKINQERQKRLPLGYLAFSQLHLPGISSVLPFDIAATDENEGSRPFDVAATSDEERVNRVPHLCHSLSWNQNVWSPVRIFGHIENCLDFSMELGCPSGLHHPDLLQ